MPKIMIVGGVARSLLNFRGDLIDEWLNMGYDVLASAAPVPDELEQKLLSKGIRFNAIPLDRDAIDPLQDLKVLYAIYKIMQSEKPDYLFCYTVKPVIYASIVARLFPGVKVYTMITGLGYAFSSFSIKQKLLTKLLILLYRYALRKNKVIFFQNPDDRNLFEKLRIISGNQNTILINGSGVNVTHYNYNKVASTNEIVFLLISRMLKSKGIEVYVEAASLIKNKYNHVSFKLLGPLSTGPDGLKFSKLQNWVKSGLIEYLGKTTDVRPVIESSSIYVLPSYYREGVPRSILEAMAMGRPIITTDAPGCRETVEEGVNGFLVPVRNSEALAKAMESFILNPDLISKMGKESRRIAEDKFDVRKVNKVILEAMELESKEPAY